MVAAVVVIVAAAISVARRGRRILRSSGSVKVRPYHCGLSPSKRGVEEEEGAGKRKKKTNSRRRKREEEANESSFGLAVVSRVEWKGSKKKSSLTMAGNGTTGVCSDNGLMSVSHLLSLFGGLQEGCFCWSGKAGEFFFGAG